MYTSYEWHKNIAVFFSQVYSLFVDVKRSTQFLLEYNQEFMFSEVDNEDDEDEDEEEDEDEDEEDEDDDKAMDIKAMDED